MCDLWKILLFLKCTFSSHDVQKLFTPNQDRGVEISNDPRAELVRSMVQLQHVWLYIKLMKRRLPAKLLDLLAYWLDNCSSCVK